jgi:hypothetical protein
MLAVTNNNYAPYIATTTTRRANRRLRDERRLWLASAVFVATLHRLFVSGSDRDCSVWMEDYDIHFYRAMAWLGVSLCYLAELSIVDLGVGGSYAGAAIGDWRTGFFWTIS